MKKIMILTISCLLCFLVGCNNKEPEQPTEKVEDSIKPLIKIASNFKVVNILIGETLNIMEGVTAIDNIDGDITSKIQYNDEELDLETEGSYSVYFYVKDSSNNQADEVFKVINVINPNVIVRPDIYLGDIANEAAKPSIPPTFSGAWYHKVVSADDYWCGIEGVIQLPVVDINRYDGAYDDSLLIDPKAKNLDNPSVYMGGNAITESDVGLSLSKVLLKDGKLSTGSYAFRPFWRYITTADKADLGGYDLANGRNYAVSLVSQGKYSNCISTYHYSFTEYYYLPGDVLRMIVSIPEPNMMQLQIEVIEVSKLPESIKIRKENNWKDPADFKSPTFSSPGHGTNMKAHYKRVNAIDQVANEGGTEINTTTSVTNAIWKEVFLYRMIDGKLRSVPMIDKRIAVLNNPDNDYFTVNKYLYNNQDYGGMKIDIHPGRKN